LRRDLDVLPKPQPESQYDPAPLDRLAVQLADHMEKFDSEFGGKVMTGTLASQQWSIDHKFNPAPMGTNGGRPGGCGIFAGTLAFPS